MIYKIDGIRMQLAQPDVDGDGNAGGIEKIESHRDMGVVNFQDKSELGEALEHQNKDTENERGMSSVDFISRINEIQHGSMSAVTYLARAHVISQTARDLVTDLMRKSVSLQGKGREEFVQVVVGNTVKKQQQGMQNLGGQVK